MKKLVHLFAALFLLAFSASSAQAQCNFSVVIQDSTACDSTAYLSISGVPMDSVIWSNGSTSERIIVPRVVSTTYTVSVTDNGCTAVSSFTISAASPLMTSAIVTQRCGFGDVDLTVSGSIGPYTYLWSNGATTQDVQNITPNSYVLISTANGCSRYYSPNILASNAGFPINLRDTSTCSDSLAILSVSPGFANATYLWSNGATTESIHAVRTSLYGVTVTHPQTFCTTSDTIFPSSQGNANFNVVSTVTQNCGFGNVNLTVAGGTAPFTYLWSNGATTQNVVNIARNSNVIVTSANGCMQTHTPNILPNNSNFFINLRDSSSCGDTLANLHIPFFANSTYLWSTGATTRSIYVPRNAVYGVTVTNTQSLCTSSNSITAPAMSSNLSASSTVVQNCGFGNVNLTVSGGTAPYTYQWSNGATTQNVVNIARNSNVIVRSANGCTQTHVPNILASNAGFGLNLRDSSSCNDVLANLIASPSPLFAGATYRWSTGATTQNIYVARNVMYRVTVTHPQTLCSSAGTITAPSQANAGFNVVSTVAQNCGFGHVYLTVSGGTAPYAYLWSNGATTQNVQNAPYNSFVTVTSANGCTQQHRPNIDSAHQLAAAIIDSTNCNDSLATLLAYTIPYQPSVLYMWSNGSSSNTIYNGLSGANYSVTATNLNNGCSAVASITVANNNNSPMSLSSVITRTLCNSNGLGAAVDLTVSGGVAPYLYQWSNGESVEDAQNLAEGDDVFVIDARGCVVYHSPNIVGGFDISSVLTANSCSQNNGRIIIYPLDSARTYTYLWTNGATTANNTGLSTGWYAVTVSQNNPACTLIRDFYVPNSSNCQTTITGQVFNASGTGTCAANQPNMISGWVRLTNTATNNHIYVSVINGTYSLTTSLSGTYTLSYFNQLYNNQLSVLCPTNNIYTITIPANGGNINGGDFYVAYPNQVDAGVDIYSGGAVPGLAYWEVFFVCNYGAQPISGTVTYHYDQLLSNPVLSSTNLTLVSHNTANTTATFSYSNMPSGFCYDATADFTIPANMPLGTELTSTVTVTQTGDSNSANNSAYNITTVASSYDPNDKRMTKHRSGNEFVGGIYAADNQMEYIIRFQNTGTAPARRVVVRDTLEANLLPETISEMMNSHNGIAHIEDNNILVIEFDNIFLPEAAVDLAGSQGYIKFNIMRTAGLPLGTSIRNNAAIYFDFNAPIITNTAISTLEEELVSVENLTNALQVQVMPNPFDAQITAQYELKNEGKVSVRLYNALGQVALQTNINTQTAGQHNITLSTADLSSGIYWLQIESNDGKYTQKVIKQ